ncbi:hypothetical protein T4B_11440 [Trichinella pseudospiralis]|nr:hypothetical protein T4A_13163 [Trichinella pseudospiralis]KRZ12743.1 hypothetical protein T4B_11440 [Trichinella pseudospiralis]
MEVAQAKQKEKNFNYINNSDQKEDRPSFARKKGVVSAAFDFLQKKPRWDGGLLATNQTYLFFLWQWLICREIDK